MKNDKDRETRRLERKYLCWRLATEIYTAIFVTVIVVLLLLGYGGK